MLQVRIKEQSLFARLAARKLKSHTAAIVFGRTIHLWNISEKTFLDDRRLLAHELQHVRQYKRYGFLPFIFLYLLESLRKGYHNNKFEIEARQAERESVNDLM